MNKIVIYILYLFFSDDIKNGSVSVTIQRIKFNNGDVHIEPLLKSPAILVTARLFSPKIPLRKPADLAACDGFAGIARRLGCEVVRRDMNDHGAADYLFDGKPVRQHG